MKRAETVKYKEGEAKKEWVMKLIGLKVEMFGGMS